MSIKQKLPLIFTILVFLILLANNTLHFIRSKKTLLDYNEREIRLITQEVSLQVENAREGSLYVENLIGRELRTASIAIKNSLPPKYEDVTNQQLVKVAKEVNVSHITLFAKTKNDIVGVRSSDPHEINLSTKEWGYWYNAFQQLYSLKPVTVKEGLTLPNYWSGPIEIASSNTDHVDKWGYFYDGTTNYMIDPYMRDNAVLDYETQFGPDKIMDRIIKEMDGILGLAVFNPARFGKEKEIVTINGNTYTKLSAEPIPYGLYNYSNMKRDTTMVHKAIQTGKVQTYEAVIDGKEVQKTFVPIMKGKQDQYVIGLVYDYGLLKSQLNQELVEHIALSVTFMIIVILISFIFSHSITNPIGKIVDHVNKIAQGQFGKTLFLKRKDELGVLTQNINALSNNLASYVNELSHSKTIIEYHANHDPLTGLPNRRFLLEKLIEFIDGSVEGEQVSVIFFDLDRFKDVNDSLGHSKGDELLKLVSNRMKSLIPMKDSIISRQGGDEFIILIKGLELDDVKVLAEKIVDEIQTPFYIDKNEIYLGASCGISVFPIHGEDSETLIASADMAMYASKKQGGNLVTFFDKEISKESKNRLAIESNLRKAIEEGKIEIYYQPKVDALTGKTVGVEALSRWNHEELGFIPPTLFIPVAEETGMIQLLWEYTMKKACSQVSLWNQNRMEPLSLSVNFSARQFQNPAESVAMVKKILADSQLHPSNFEIEITESILLSNAKEVIIALKELREYGISVSIDDFGTGYSSLSYLKNLPIDTLKIDKSFIQDIQLDYSNSEIVDAIINLARSLKLKVIAEGVEEDFQKEYLLKNQCFLMQGYLFSKPLSVDEITDFLH